MSTTAVLELLTSKPSVETVPRRIKLDSSVQTKWLFGRHQGAVDYVLDSTLKPNMISRKHAQVWWNEKAKTFHLDALQAVNGCLVNDIKVQAHTLREGDVVVFGEAGGMPMGQSKSGASNTAELRYMFHVNSNSVGSKRKRSESVDDEEAKEQAEKLQALQKRVKQLEEEEKKKRELELKIQELQSEKEQQERDFKMRQEKISRDAQQERERLSEELKRREEEAARLSKGTSEQQALAAQKEAEIQRLLKEKERVEELRQQQLQQLEQIKHEDEEKKRQTQEALQLAEQRMKSLESDLNLQKQQNSKIKEVHEKAQENLRCVVCTEVLVETRVTSCGHSMCATCMTGWLKKDDSCPMCRADIVEVPRPSIQMDNTAEIHVQGMDDDDRESRKERKDQYANDKLNEHKQYESLKKKWNKAQRNQQKFMDIHEAWNLDEAKIFQAMMLKQPGAECRALYATMVGLTETFRTGASDKHLRMAAANLRVKGVDPSSPHTTAVTIEKIRWYIWLYIQFGCMKHIDAIPTD